MLLRADDAGPSALRPRRELLDSGGTERVGRSHHHRAAVDAQEVRELSDGRRLTNPVHADHQRHRRTLAQVQGRVELREALLDELAEHPLQVLRVLRVEPGNLVTQLLDDLVGDIRPEVRCDQRLFEVIPRRLVDLLPAEHAAQSAGQ